MVMQEFASRFSSEDEGSFLFEILRRIGRLDPLAMTSSGDDPPPQWAEWSSSTDPSDPPRLGVAQA